MYSSTVIWATNQQATKIASNQHNLEVAITIHLFLNMKSLPQILPLSLLILLLMIIDTNADFLTPIDFLNARFVNTESRSVFPLNDQRFHLKVWSTTKSLDMCLSFRRGFWLHMTNVTFLWTVFGISLNGHL